MLDALPASERDALVGLARLVTLRVGDVLYEQGEPVRDAHFLTSGAASVLVALSDGRALEPAIVGREGVLGFPMGLGEDRARWRSIVQVRGEAYAVPMPALTEVLRRPGELGPLLTHYAGLLVTFVAQSAACTHFHEIRERAARWLLVMHDRTEADEFPITHEWMAHMLGTSRPTLTHELGFLAGAGLIEQGRGVIRIRDRGGLEAAACECYAHVQDAFEELVSAPSARAASEGHYQPGGAPGG